MYGRVAMLMICLISALALVMSAQEPVKNPLSPRIITATRQVITFTDLETQMLRAIQTKDRASLSNLVSEDCLLEMPDSDPLTADEWMTAVLSKDYSLKSFVVRQVSVIDQADFAIVKFDRLQQGTFKGTPDGGEFFVVDLWKKNGNGWKLENRYVSKVSSVPWMPKTDVHPKGKQ